MLKLAGCICLFLASTGYGLMQARKYRERPRQLRQLRTALKGLETEIAYAATPLPVAFHRISKRQKGVISNLFRQVGERIEQTDWPVEKILQEEMNQLAHQLFLRVEDKAVIEDLTSTLGISDRKDQLKHIELANQNLYQLEIQASEERTKFERMWNYLGPLVGLMLFVLLY